MTIMTPPQQDARALRHAADAARRMRSEWLVAVAEGLVTIDDVLDEASTESGRPLQKISLRQLLLAQPFVGESRKDEVLRRMADILSDEVKSSREVTTCSISFILDPRAGGRRYIALQDARSGQDTPVSGFPFAPLVVSGVRSFVQGGKGR
jgi:hypothetical protein